MPIDVLLVNPPYKINAPFKYNMIDPPRNLTVIAAWLERRNIEVQILDAAILELSFEDVESEIHRIRPRVIGISNRSTYNFPIVQRVAQIAKKINGDVKVVVGGTYVTWAPDDALNRTPEIDYIIVGEGDISAPELFDTLLNNDDPSTIHGIAYRNGDNEVIVTPHSIMISDLGAVPFPANHLLPINVYIERKERYIIALTRGCLFTCEYCTSSFQRGSYRTYPLDHIIVELQWAYDKGFRYIFFPDYP